MLQLMETDALSQSKTVVKDTILMMNVMDVCKTSDNQALQKILAFQRLSIVLTTLTMSV